MKATFADRLQIVVTFLTAVSLFFVAYQLRQNDKTTRVAIRGQLYDREAGMAVDEAADPSHAFGTVWARTPITIRGSAYSRHLLALVTADEPAIGSQSASALFENMYNASVFTDKARRERTEDLRRTFLFAQTNLYHMHLSHDYWRDGILSEAEWRTWKGIVREMRAHPMLLTVIWHGYEHRYLSRSFARFLQKEVCNASDARHRVERAERQRECEFVRFFYPEMLHRDWPESLPNY